MALYDYKKHVIDDSVDHLKDLPASMMPDLTDPDGLCDYLDPIVTGSGDGSYTFDKIQAEQNLVGNWSLLRAAYYDLLPDFVAIEEPELCDVLVRSYVLRKNINTIIKLVRKR